MLGIHLPVKLDTMTPEGIVSPSQCPKQALLGFPTLKHSALICLRLKSGATSSAVWSLIFLPPHPSALAPHFLHLTPYHDYAPTAPSDLPGLPLLGGSLAAWMLALGIERSSMLISHPFPWRKPGAQIPLGWQMFAFPALPVSLLSPIFQVLTYFCPTHPLTQPSLLHSGVGWVAALNHNPDLADSFFSHL